MDRRRRLIMLIGMIAVLGLLMTLSNEPEIDLTVDQLMDAPDAHEGDTFRIRGTIVEGGIDAANHTLILAGENHTVRIDTSGAPLPAGATDGKTISVRGEFSDSNDGWTFHAHEIKTGCPSKYEIEAEAETEPSD